MIEGAVYQTYNRAFGACRRALELKAAPPWLTLEHKEAIHAIYAEAARLSVLATFTPTINGF